MESNHLHGGEPPVDADSAMISNTELLEALRYQSRLSFWRSLFSVALEPETLIARPAILNTRPSTKLYRGVWRQRLGGKWMVQIRPPRSRTHLWLGTFDTAEGAALAYDSTAFLLFGRSARLNFPGRFFRLNTAADLDCDDELKRALDAAKRALVRAGYCVTMSALAPSNEYVSITIDEATGNAVVLNHPGGVGHKQKGLNFVLSLMGLFVGAASACWEGYSVIKEAFGPKWAPFAYGAVWLPVGMLGAAAFVALVFDKSPKPKVFIKFALMLFIVVAVGLPLFVLGSMILG